jgi:hypothetical protein
MSSCSSCGTVNRENLKFSLSVSKKIEHSEVRSERKILCININIVPPDCTVRKPGKEARRYHMYLS